MKVSNYVIAKLETGKASGILEQRGLTHAEALLNEPKKVQAFQSYKSNRIIVVISLLKK